MSVTDFRKRLTAGETLVGTFLRTPSPVSAEILSLTNLDAFCIDVEHAPFGRLELDLCLATFRAAGRPCLVRVADASPTEIRNALDSGAAGIVVPHVLSAEQARSIVRAAHFGEGGRGYAGATRAADYTTRPMREHLDYSRDNTTVILQIEDIAALDQVAEIAAVDGVDCLFVGRVDLSVAMGKSVDDPEVIETVRRICAECRDQGTAIGMFTPNLDEIPGWIDDGANLFLLGSDQSFVLSGANALADRVQNL